MSEEFIRAYIQFMIQWGLAPVYDWDFGWELHFNRDSLDIFMIIDRVKLSREDSWEESRKKLEDYLAKTNIS